MTVLGTTFRLGSTSYVWPADILPNVRNLGPHVDDVELVLFEAADASNLPDRSTVAELGRLALEHDLTYTVHLPLDLALDDSLSLEKAEQVIACTRSLSPWGYVLHLDGRSVEGDPDDSQLQRWRASARSVLERLSAVVGEAPSLSIENLENYDPRCFLGLLDRLPVSLCIDVGHLWLTGQDPVPYLDEHLDRARVIHLHGIGERDHKSLLLQGVERVAPVLELLTRRGFCGVVTLEVFSREDLFSSRAMVEEFVNGRT